MNIISIAGTFSAAAYCIYFILFVSIHFKNTEYKITKHALSDYDIGSTHKLFQYYNLSGAIAGLSLAAAFYFSDNNIFHSTVPVLFAVMIICRTGLSIFKTAIEGQKLTFISLLHYMFAAGSFAAAFIIIRQVNAQFLERNLQAGIRIIILSYNYLLTIILTAVCITIFKPLRYFFGISERLYILTAATWFFLISILFAVNGSL
ncbi:MAG: DUF998 domain-containing protein [Spirochaetes bacterium]|nr:DUF998 domain-containing protein [Spirochaetota bacterium]